MRASAVAKRQSIVAAVQLRSSPPRRPRPAALRGPRFAIQALLGENSQFYFCHVQLRAVGGRGMDLQLVGHPAGFGRRERLIERDGAVGVDVVYDQQIRSASG
jgi:hypothetical protein